MKHRRRLLPPDLPAGWQLCLDCGTWVKPKSANCFCDLPPGILRVVKEAMKAADALDDGADYHDLVNRVFDIKLALAEVS